MKKILLFLCICLMVFCTCTVCAETIVYDNLIEEITQSRAKSVYNIDLNAPFAKEKSGIREEVDIQTGNVCINYDFFSLPDHGEVNNEFGVVYNLNLAKDKSETISEDGLENTTTQGDGSIVLTN